MKAFRLFPKVCVDYIPPYIPYEKKSVSPYSLEKAKKKAIKIADELGYIKIFPNIIKEINNANDLDSIADCMSKCRRAC